MTSNQMILLLAIYRGTENQELVIGTRQHDLDTLTSMGLIDMSLEDPLTDAGNDHVLRVLNLA